MIHVQSEYTFISLSYSTSSDQMSQMPPSLSTRRGISFDSFGEPKDFFSNFKKTGTGSVEEYKHEHRKVSTSNITKIIKDGVTQETHETTNQQVKNLQAGDISYHEAKHSQQVKDKIEGEGFSAERLAAQRQDQKVLKCGDVTKERTMNSKAHASRVTTEEGTLENVAMSKEEDRKQFNRGVLEQRLKQKEIAASRTLSDSNGITTRVSTSNRQTSDALHSPTEPDTYISLLALPSSNQYTPIAHEVRDDFKQLLQPPPQNVDIKKTVNRVKEKMCILIEKLKKATETNGILEILEPMQAIVRSAWTIPTHGYELGYSLCNLLRDKRCLEKLLEYCLPEYDPALNFKSAQLIEQILSAENLNIVVDKGLVRMTELAVGYSDKTNVEIGKIRVGLGILCHMFKHSEETCSYLIKKNAVSSITFNCRSSDTEILRHCATAMTNLALYGGCEDQQSAISERYNSVSWLFPLTLNNDETVVYLACIAVAAMCVNKEVAAKTVQQMALGQLFAFCGFNNTEDFLARNEARIHGQSKDWLARFLPVLSSNIEPARAVTAYHFAMEAIIKKRQGNLGIFKEIGAIAALKNVASSPHALASKLAAQALQIIGEDIPHKLSQQVPLWTEHDVIQWVEQIGFKDRANEFLSTKVDGDLLLQIDEVMLADDIGIKKQLLRKRFLRELKKLKQIADYSSVDTSNIAEVLHEIDPEFTQYTYGMLRSGIDRKSLPHLNDEQLRNECDIQNSIHRQKILSYMTVFCQDELEALEAAKKNIDVFISYRRNNGSQLASLLKVHLQLKGFHVFLDVERLEAGNFDKNLLNSIKQAKTFLLVLTRNSLDRCKNDDECTDWVHKEVVQAIKEGCNIIPVWTDDFIVPDRAELPEDMRPLFEFNGVTWIHDYQDACVDKIERFIRGDKSSATPVSPLASSRYNGSSYGGRSGSVDYLERNPQQQNVTVELPQSPTPAGDD